MNLRSSALIASTLLAGCVFTDDANQTGGDFLQEHGAAVRSADSGVFDLPVVSVEAVPLEGVPSMHGTGPILLGSMGSDSTRLVVGFDLQDTTRRNAILLRGKDSLKYLRLLAYEATQGLTVRARFFHLKTAADIKALPALFAGLDSSDLAKDGAGAVLIPAKTDSEYVLPALATGESTYLGMPGAVVERLASALKDKTGWFVAILDTRTSGSDAKARFAGVTLVDRDTASTSAVDTAATLSLGVYEDHSGWRSIGLRPKGASSRVVGLWPSGGSRLRFGFDPEYLRSQMRSAFGVRPDTAGGFDHTFNILQARAKAQFASVKTEGTDPHGFVVASTVVVDSEVYDKASPVRPGEDRFELGVGISPRTIIESGLDTVPSVFFSWVPGGLHVEVELDKVASSLPTQHSLATGSYSAQTVTKFFLPRNRQVEFRVTPFVRVRVWADAEKVYVKRWTIARLPVSDAQYRDEDSTRREAMFWNGQLTTEQEVRTPLTQLLNRAEIVEWEIAPRTSADPSDRFIAVPEDTTTVFETVRLKARTLAGGSN